MDDRTTHETLQPAAVGNRRAPVDRRFRPTPMFSRYALWGGRRRLGRRGGEHEGSFVDMHGPLLFSLVLAVVALNILDAVFTLLFLSYGGKELNPIVDAVLQMGPIPFLLLKSVGIGVCVAFLSITANFRASRTGLAVVLAGYTALLGWHLYLLDWLGL